MANGFSTKENFTISAKSNTTEEQQRQQQQQQKTKRKNAHKLLRQI